MRPSGTLPPGWRIARFDEFLHRVERKILVDDTTPYSRVGVRWYGKGPFIRDEVSGMEIARKQQWVIRTGDIVYNKLFAWKGSFAIADGSVDGCIVSDKFPTYDADQTQVDLRFLGYYFQTPQLARQAQDLSRGAAAISKLTLNPPQFWDLTVPLPPLEEQQRIVARIEGLVTKVETTQQLRQQAAEEAAKLFASSTTQVLGDASLGTELSDILLEKPRNGWSARCDNAEGGTPVLRLSAVTGYAYRESEFKRTSEPTLPDAHYWLQEGDLLITRSNAPDLVGHAAIYNGSPSPCIFPDLMMRLRVDQSQADTRFVHCWLRSTPVRRYIAQNAKGTSPSMKKISQKTVMRIPFPVGISLGEQRRIVAYLDDLQARVAAVQELQAATAAALEALLPSVLDKAFKGEF